MGNSASSTPNRRSTTGGGNASVKWAAAAALDPSSPADFGSLRGGQMVEGLVQRKPRPPTAHQLAVERNRAQRVEYIIGCGLRRQHHSSRKVRRVDGIVYRVWQRNQAALLDDPTVLDDSEEEDYDAARVSVDAQLESSSSYAHRFRERGLGGLSQLASEADEYGEAALTYASVVRRAARRLTRWADGRTKGIVATRKRSRATEDVDEDVDEDDGDEERTMVEDEMGDV